MEMVAAIKVENLAKVYKIGHLKQRNDTLRDQLVASLRGLGRRKPAGEDELWALKDVSFEVQPGEVVGVIGRNGAGKSTLLKILARITEPTSGRAVINGRVGSLLEVGTGFHPELTGRENIYLNGAILGMRRTEIARKFDEIVAFSEIEKFLDTPVKRYSSGMYVRLAFAVAAHLEPEILLVDEVLAVGDASFQKKCLGKMGEVAGEGRTVLFVSHNMRAISHICSRGIWINDGIIQKDGPSQLVISDYITEIIPVSNSVFIPANQSKPMQLREIAIKNNQSQNQSRLNMAEPFSIRLRYDVNRPVANSHVICFIYTSDGVNVFGTGDSDTNNNWAETRDTGSYVSEIRIPANLLGEGRYTLTVSLGKPYMQVYDRHENVIGFEIIDESSKRSKWQQYRRPGILGIDLDWKVQKDSHYIE